MPINPGDIRRRIAGAAALGSMIGRGLKQISKLKNSGVRGRPKGSKNKINNKIQSSNTARVARILRGATGMITQSEFSLHNSPSKKVAAMEMVVPTKVLTSNSAYAFSCDAGFQNYVSSIALGTPTLQALTQLLPDLSGNQQSGTKRLVVKSHELDFVMTNNTNATLELEIYDIVLRKDLPGTNYTTSNGLVYNLPPSPDGYWAQGTLASEGRATTFTPPPSQLLGVQPYDSQFFKDYFKVMQKRTIHLPLGAGHRHQVKLSPNEMITQATATSSTIVGWKGLSVYQMFVLRGFPLTDTSANEVTTSSGNLSIVSSQRTRYCFVADTSSSGSYQDTLTTPAAIDESLINAATGVADQIRTA